MHPKALSVLAVLLSACAVSVGAANANLKRRNFHSIAVLGDWLYIDGGSLSSWYEKGQPDRVPVNSTYAIPLKEPWMNASVVFRETAYAGAVHTVEQAGLWPAPDGKTMYRWGGASNNRSAVDASYAKTLYQFTADGNGGGAWAETRPVEGNAGTFNELRVTRQGAAATCGGYGVYMGGQSSSLTEYGVIGQGQGDGWFPQPGMVTYDMARGTYANVSSAGYSTDGVLENAKAHCVEGFGDEPLVLFLGGGVKSVLGGKALRQNSLATVSLYNPARQTWVHQQTSADDSAFGSLTAPDSRSQFCMTGARGKNGTYEIFVYGGWNDYAHRDMDDVWVLSLPAFRWFKAPSAKAPGRRYHECATVGRSQMISVGGATGNTDKAFSQLEQWPNGIGVLDMNTVQWVDGYNPDAGDYDTPSFIKEYYQERDYSGRLIWASDPDFKKSFAGLGIMSASSDKGSSTPESADSASSPNIGAIVGGVVGGVALVALIAGAVWFFLRRRRLASATADELPRHEPQPSSSQSQTGSSQPCPSQYGEHKGHYYSASWATTQTMSTSWSPPPEAHRGPPPPVYEIHDARYGRPNVVEPPRMPTPPPQEMVGV